jgi:hypothetical protein
VSRGEGRLAHKVRNGDDPLRPGIPSSYLLACAVRYIRPPSAKSLVSAAIGGMYLVSWRVLWDGEERRNFRICHGWWLQFSLGVAHSRLGTLSGPVIL